MECNKLIAYLKLDGGKSQLSRKRLCTNGSDNANFAQLLEILYLSRGHSFPHIHQFEHRGESSVLFSSLVPESFKIENLLLPADMIHFESELSFKYLAISLISFSFLILFLVCLFVSYQKIQFKTSKLIFLLQYESIIPSYSQPFIFFQQKYKCQNTRNELLCFI